MNPVLCNDSFGIFKSYFDCEFLEIHYIQFFKLISRIYIHFTVYPCTAQTENINILSNIKLIITITTQPLKSISLLYIKPKRYLIL